MDEACSTHEDIKKSFEILIETSEGFTARNDVKTVNAEFRNGRGRGLL
jgi:hypothetical protein